MTRPNCRRPLIAEDGRMEPPKLCVADGLKGVAVFCLVEGIEVGWNGRICTELVPSGGGGARRHPDLRRAAVTDEAEVAAVVEAAMVADEAEAAAGAEAEATEGAEARRLLDMRGAATVLVDVRWS
uniref:DUF834 domain-containing protein n=1 Tax=Oryza meridionalis TaxID=40149 RepID=A0A0E0EYB0_9ORYZ